MKPKCYYLLLHFVLWLRHINIICFIYMLLIFKIPELHLSLAQFCNNAINNRSLALSVIIVKCQSLLVIISRICLHSTFSISSRVKLGVCAHAFKLMYVSTCVYAYVCTFLFCVYVYVFFVFCFCLCPLERTSINIYTFIQFTIFNRLLNLNAFNMFDIP